jgi:hypothetical protein
MTRAQYMAALVPLAKRFVAAIHDDGPDVASDVLTTLYGVPRPAGVVATRAFMTVLAAMVDPTKTDSQLLGWVAELPAAAQPARQRPPSVAA